eukprot:TRINITY_DN15064_c0_g1_i1.p1 TRINITY_DN15064_c0_g1~~TRINITY_DN15064_c0_g1_i1.p1  ORF type:complete len:364 (+),score=71.22 TRINITY_DN15064_c0_g1_i1:30-1121(+)
MVNFPQVQQVYTHIHELKTRVETLLHALLRTGEPEPMDALVREIHKRITWIETQFSQHTIETQVFIDNLLASLNFGALNDEINELQRKLNNIDSTLKNRALALINEYETEAKELRQSESQLSQLISKNDLLAESIRLELQRHPEFNQANSQIWDLTSILRILGIEHARGVSAETEESLLRKHESLRLTNAQKEAYVSVGDELADYESWLHALSEVKQSYWFAYSRLYLVVDKKSITLIFAEKLEVDLSGWTINSIVGEDRSSYQFGQGVRINGDLGLVILHPSELNTSQYTQIRNFEILTNNRLRWTAPADQKGQVINNSHIFELRDRNNTVISHIELHPTAVEAVIENYEFSYYSFVILENH